jgi:putative lipoprotein
MEMRKALLVAAGLLATMPAANAKTFTFHCALNVDLAVRYPAKAQVAVIRTRGTTFRLPLAMSGSGARYSDGKTTFWEHAGEASFETPGASFTGCKR